MRLIDADELSKWISGQSKSPSCPKDESSFGLRIMKYIDRMPSVQPEERTEERTETHACDYACDCISRQAAIGAICNACGKIDCDQMDTCGKIDIQPINSSEIPNSSDTISRQAAIALADSLKDNLPDDERKANCVIAHNEGILEYQTALSLLPFVQPEPSEMTDEQAILHLQSTGWMQNHDREMYESGLRERLADDSGGYDSLIPCDDAISRQDAIRWVKTECNPYGKPTLDFESGKRVMEHLKTMPSVQPDIIACGDCKHYIPHDKRCGYWNHGVKPLEWCSQAERRTDDER